MSSSEHKKEVTAAKSKSAATNALLNGNLRSAADHMLDAAAHHLNSGHLVKAREAMMKSSEINERHNAIQAASKLTLNDAVSKARANLSAANAKVEASKAKLSVASARVAETKAKLSGSSFGGGAGEQPRDEKGQYDSY